MKKKMTKEEAIDCIKDMMSHKIFVLDTNLDDKVMEALRLAIESLKGTDGGIHEETN